MTNSLLIGFIESYIILPFILNFTISIINLNQSHLFQDLLFIQLMLFCRLYQSLQAAFSFLYPWILFLPMELLQACGLLVSMIMLIWFLLKVYYMLALIAFIISLGGKTITMGRLLQFVIDFMGPIVIQRESQGMAIRQVGISKV